MKFKIDKCKVMHYGVRNMKAEYEMDVVIIWIITEEKDLGIIVKNSSKVYKPVQKAVNKVNKILGILKRTFLNKDKNVMIHLLKSLVRPHLKYATIQAWI